MFIHLFLKDLYPEYAKISYLYEYKTSVIKLTNQFVKWSEDMKNYFVNNKEAYIEQMNSIIWIGV